MKLACPTIQFIYINLVFFFCKNQSGKIHFQEFHVCLTSRLESALKGRICSTGSKYFLLRVDPILWKGYVVHWCKRGLITVVPISPRYLTSKFFSIQSWKPLRREEKMEKLFVPKVYLFTLQNEPLYGKTEYLRFHQKCFKWYSIIK